jgi:hypothetical protein
MSIEFIFLDSMKLTSYPLDLPDLILSYFFRFDYVKRKLIRYHVENITEFLVCIGDILSKIPSKSLNTIFPWIDEMTMEMYWYEF